MKTAFLFPGQGAQYPGMGKDLYESEPNVRELFEEASELTGRNWANIIFEGTMEELKSTDVTQVAITLCNIATSMALHNRGITATVCAGFSLGEFSALYEAGVLNRRDVLRVVEKRGEILERISRTKDSPKGPVGMTAVLGLHIDEITDAINGIADAYIAIHSGPNQTVLAGTAVGLSQAESALNAAGAMNLIRLHVSGPFHSPLLTDAREEFAEILNGVTFSEPNIPVFVNTTGKSPASGKDVKQSSLDQLDHKVCWVDCQNAVMALGPDRILEVGPGTVLTGLWKTLRNGMKVQPAGRLEDIGSFV